MVTALILIAAYLAVASTLIYIKDCCVAAKYRRDDRLATAYQRQEAARLHAYHLDQIARIRRETAEELIRVAGGDEDVIEGTAVEVRRP